VRELAGYPFQLTLVNPFSFLFSYISPTYYHAADDSLVTFPGGGPGERLGHSTIAVTLDTYSHVAPGLQEAAAKRFDEAFTTKYNKHAGEMVH
jgi:hypothetical protein